MTEQDYAFEKPDDEKKKNPTGMRNDPSQGDFGLNRHLDLGSLLTEDTQSYEGITMQEFSKRTAASLCQIYQALFEMKKTQKAAHGPDGEILEYTKSQYSVEMPAPRVVLPREKPVPKEKEKTKWEKFREERGMPPRHKRSRLVFDPITKDWVPRWGKGSVKKIAEKMNFAMEEKPKHRAAGMDPFTFAKAEKNAMKEKQNLASIKNQIHAVSARNMKGEVKVLESKQSAAVKDTMKLKSDEERSTLRKREHKALMKSLKMAQMSTASMGRFDRKASKQEPDAPKSLKVQKKRSNEHMFKLSADRSLEKERNMKIFGMLQKKKEMATGHIDDTKLAKVAKKKYDKARKYATKE